jgi:hypothetical protein
MYAKCQFNYDLALDRAFFCGTYGLIVYIDLVKLDSFGVFRNLFKYRGDQTTWTTPGCPKVDKHWFARADLHMMSLASAQSHRSNYGLTCNLIEVIVAGDSSDTHSYKSVVGSGEGAWSDVSSGWYVAEVGVRCCRAGVSHGIL